MKITAEFDSNEELLSFISTFGTKTVSQITKGASSPKVEATKKEVKEDVGLTKPVLLHSPDKEENKKDNISKVDAKEDKAPTENAKDAENVKEDETSKDEEPKTTKEMVRGIFGKLIKAGKASEAKELTKKYGASKVPDIKEEDYEAVFKEAEGLL